MSKQVRILVIYGHGGSDVGAVSNGLIERDMNIVTGKALVRELRRCGFDVTEDSLDTKVADEIALVKKGSYDLVISIHYNAGGGDGFEAFYWSSSSSALALCKSIESQVKALGQNSRGCKVGDSLAIINSVSPVSILLEGGFVDNVTDKALFDTKEEQDSLGVAYAKGVCEYYGVKFQSEIVKKHIGKYINVKPFMNTLSIFKTPEYFETWNRVALLSCPISVKVIDNVSNNVYKVKDCRYGFEGYVYIVENNNYTFTDYQAYKDQEKPKEVLYKIVANGKQKCDLTKREYLDGIIQRCLDEDELSIVISKCK